MDWTYVYYGLGGLGAIILLILLGSYCHHLSAPTVAGAEDEAKLAQQKNGNLQLGTLGGRTV